MVSARRGATIKASLTRRGLGGLESQLAAQIPAGLRAAYASCWLHLLECTGRGLLQGPETGRKPPDQAYRSLCLGVLDGLVRVGLARLNAPYLVADHLSGLVRQELATGPGPGDFQALRALDALFQLVVAHRLEHAPLYTHLYGLLDPASPLLWHPQSCAELLVLSTILLLRARQVSLSLVLAFVKRLARTALYVPPFAAAPCLVVAYNLLLAHPAARILLYRPLDRTDQVDRAILSFLGPSEVLHPVQAKAGPPKQNQTEPESEASGSDGSDHATSEQESAAASDDDPLDDLAPEICKILAGLGVLPPGPVRASHSGSEHAEARPAPSMFRSARPEPVVRPPGLGLAALPGPSGPGPERGPAGEPNPSEIPQASRGPPPPPPPRHALAQDLSALVRTAIVAPGPDNGKLDGIAPVTLWRATAALSRLDPYDAQRASSSFEESGATRSSLWEIAILMAHHDPAIAQLARRFSRSLESASPIEIGSYLLPIGQETVRFSAPTPEDPAGYRLAILAQYAVRRGEALGKRPALGASWAEETTTPASGSQGSRTVDARGFLAQRYGVAAGKGLTGRRSRTRERSTFFGQIFTTEHARNPDLAWKWARVDPESCFRTTATALASEQEAARQEQDKGSARLAR